MAKAIKAAAPKKGAAKKTDTKKVTAEKSETGYKYADKSAGQPELVPIFDKLNQLISAYEKGSLKKRGGKGGQVALVSEKEVEIVGRKYKEVHFAAALIQKGYVGFYFMPVYIETEMKNVFKPGLLKLLKGKACFYVKKYEEEIFEQIKEALKIGYGLYKKNNWID